MKTFTLKQSVVSELLGVFCIICCSFSSFSQQQLDSLQYRLVEEVFSDTIDQGAIRELVGDYSVCVNTDSSFRAYHICHLATWATLWRGADSVNKQTCQVILSEMQTVIGARFNERKNVECSSDERLLLDAAGEFVLYTGAPLNPPKKSGIDKAISNFLDGRFGYVIKRLITDGGGREWLLVIVFGILIILGGLTIIKWITKPLKKFLL